MATDADRIFRAFCILCWIIWLVLGLLAIVGLLLSRTAADLIHKEEVLGLFTISTYFCIGLPIAIKLLFKAIERYRSTRRP